MNDSSSESNVDGSCTEDYNGSNDVYEDCSVSASGDYEYRRSNYTRKRHSKINLLVGFLRLANVVQCITAIFTIINSTLGPLIVNHASNDTIWKYINNTRINDPFTRERSPIDQLPFLIYVQGVAGLVQLIYLFVSAIVVIIDNVATINLRLMEYEELTHTETDARSILFLISESRWKLRILTTLSLTSVMYVGAAQMSTRYYPGEQGTNNSSIRVGNISENGFHAMIWYMSLMAGGCLSFIMGFFLYLMSNRFLDVPWLKNYQEEDHPTYKQDAWRNITSIQDTKANLQSSHKNLTFPGFAFESIKRVLYVAGYVSSLAINFHLILIAEKEWLTAEFWAFVSSLCCTSIMSIYLLLSVIREGLQTPHYETTFISKVYAPFVLTSSYMLLVDCTEASSGHHVAAYTYTLLLCLYCLIGIISLMAKSCWMENPIHCTFIKLINLNFCIGKESYNKVARLFNTLGNFLGLLGLILGLCSLVHDQYVLEFEADGQLKEITNGLKDFQDKMRDVDSLLKGIYQPFMNYDISCETIHATLGGGIAAGAFLSLIPGGSTVASLGTRSAYYVIKAANSLGHLGKKLNISVTRLWQVSNAITKFAVNNYQTLTVGFSAPSILCILPVLPSMVVGIQLLFSAFWPRTITFYKSIDRARFIGSLLSHWMFVLVLLVLTVITNSFILPELMTALSNSMPDFVNLNMTRKQGWTMSMMASMSTILSAISFVITFWSMKNKKNILAENRLSKENAIKKNEEKSGDSLSTWSVPLVLCLLGCSCAVLANYYPRVFLYREPKGTFKATIDNINQTIHKFEFELSNIQNGAEKQCLPFATIDDLFRSNANYSHLNNILLNPIKTFKGVSDTYLGPVKDIMAKVGREWIGDTVDGLFGPGSIDTIKNLKTLNMQYLWVVFLIPRVLQLLLLIYGFFTMIAPPCILNALPQIQKRIVVKAFGVLCIFSCIFILGTQMAIYNLLSAFEIPFFRITVKFGLGFIYDLICESIMLSIWIGIQNELFFVY